MSTGGGPAAVVADRMAAAAADLLESLDAEQRAAAQWAFPSDWERLRWFYTPTDHGGIPLGSLRPAQQQLAMRLLRTGLSRPAYVTACVIIGLENVLDELEAWSISWGRERGRDPGLYYVRVFGTPGSARWSWRFGGHHVSVQHQVSGGRVVASTPLFLGADPASAPLLGGQELRPLAGVEELARALVTSLDGADRGRAVISSIPPFDLVTANRPRLEGAQDPLPLHAVWRREMEGELRELLDSMQRRVEASLGSAVADPSLVRYSAEPKGIPGSALGAARRGLLRDLVGAYLARLPEELAAVATERYAGDGIGEVSFAWAGELEPGRPHYYRLQGPRLLVEYDNAQRDGNHAHSVLRDPVADFGADLLGEHHSSVAHPG